MKSENIFVWGTGGDVVYSSMLNVEFNEITLSLFLDFHDAWEATSVGLLIIIDFFDDPFTEDFTDFVSEFSLLLFNVISFFSTSILNARHYSFFGHAGSVSSCI